MPSGLLAIVLLPFAGSLLPFLARRLGWGPTATTWIAAAGPLAGVALLAGYAPGVIAGGVVTARWPWVPALGLDLSLRLDGLSLLFALLVLGMGLLIVLYARYYMGEADLTGRFFPLLLLFMGSMTGLVLGGNLLLLAVFWELTSVSSFLLIAYHTGSQVARRAARMALVVTGGGGLALLGGLLLLGAIAGTYELEGVLAAGERVTSHALYPPMLGLILLGAFTKSAQLPFHVWLPEAMAAPTPVSAYLHSATMVKAGIFLLARLHPAIAGGPGWVEVVAGTGLLTMVVAAYLAIFQSDLKGLLAYSTISHLGLITFLLGLAAPLAAVAAVFHVVNHATFKASLFMAAGIIDHETGTRDMRVLNGLARHMPHTALLAIVSASAMAGVPLLNGFLSKEMFFEEAIALDHGTVGRWTVGVLAALGAVFSVTYSLRFIHQTFFAGDGTGMPRAPHEPPRWMRVPVEVLATACVVVGLLPALVMGPLLAAAARPVVGGELPPYSLAIWHGFTLPLLMSGVALAGGLLLYLRLRERLDTPVIQRLARTRRHLYAQAVRGLVQGARHLTGALEHGGLRRSLPLFVVTVLVLGLVPGLGEGWRPGPIDPGPALDPASVAIWSVLVIATLATVALHRRRFVTLVLLGVVGLVVTLAFVGLSAPDLALTQLLVETVTVLLLLLALRHLPQVGAPSSRTARRSRDAALAALVGLGTAGLAWLVLTRPVEGISRYFVEHSKPLGGGTNIVNVILVDFRGFDTLGEITVLAIAALGVFALLTGVRLGSTAPMRRARDRYPLLLATVSRPLLPLMLLSSVFLLLRGHNLPGGGFIAGLLAASALTLQYIASGADWTLERLRPSFRRWAAAGLLLALVTGMGAWAFGAPFLSMTYTYVEWPVVGRFELATALLFDLGVFVTVVGAVLLILTRLGTMVPPAPDQANGREEGPWQP